MTKPFEPAEFSHDPGVQMRAIDTGAQWLDWLIKALDDANEFLDTSETAWFEIHDKIAESLKEEMGEQGRKGDPAEHWIETQARRSDRLAFQNYRRAKRLVEKLERQIRAASSAMNGRQSALKGLQDEARAPSPQPGSTWEQRWRGAA